MLYGLTEVIFGLLAARGSVRKGHGRPWVRLRGVEVPIIQKAGQRGALLPFHMPHMAPEVLRKDALCSV